MTWLANNSYFEGIYNIYTGIAYGYNMARLCVVGARTSLCTSIYAAWVHIYKSPINLLSFEIVLSLEELSIITHIFYFRS